MGNILKKMVVSLFISLVVTLVLTAAFSLALPHISAADKISGILGWILRIFSCLLAAFLCARGSKSKGFITGALVGLLYALVLFSLNGIVSKEIMPLLFAIKNLSVCVLCGAIGGILGVNCR